MKALRKLFVGGNWKSNNTLSQTQDLVKNVINELKFDPNRVEVVISPVFLHIPYVLSNVQKNVHVSAQNCSRTGYGAYTGEITAEHIKDIGLSWTILGHSERRQYYGETNDIVAEKVRIALNTGLSVIACIGEKLEERESNKTMEIVQGQLEAIKGKINENEWGKIVIAYEPVWAIGTGKTASPQQAQEVHAFIRGYLSKSVSANVADATRIIYGGSVTEKNSNELISQKDIDGFLVGGASLKPAFKDIVESCNSAQK